MEWARGTPRLRSVRPHATRRASNGALATRRPHTGVQVLTAQLLATVAVSVAVNSSPAALASPARASAKLAPSKLRR